MRILSTAFLALFSALVVGCVPHSTDSTEVGVRVAKLGIIGAQGVVKQPYEPGATYFFPPFINDWYVFDTALQNLSMTRDVKSGARAGDDSLHFKTIDGNDISVDVTVAWQIDPAMASYLVQFVGRDTREVGERLVRPLSRTIVRDVLNALASEQYYDANHRFLKAEQAAQLLNLHLNVEGVIIQQVLLGEHKFNERYEQIIRDKKVAEQDAARLRSETQAAREQRKRELEVARGEVQKSVEQARGEFEKRKISADAIYFQRQRQAEAILAEKQAEAKGIKEQARALGGSGGRNMVKLKVAEALVDTPIIFVPSGGGTDLRTTNINELLKTYGLLAASGQQAPVP